MTKLCSRCKQEKDLSEFHIDKRTQSPRSYCKVCQNIANQEWRKNNKKHVSVKNIEYQLRHKLKTLYNLTEADYASAVEQADGKCTICKRDRKLFIDHCHDKKKFRGLLCNNCNTGLGMFEDSSELLAAAILYLDTRSPT